MLALLESPRQQEDDLFIRQPFEGTDGNVESQLAAIVTLKCDSDAGRPHPAVGKASGPRGFKRAPVKSGSIGETTHWREPSGLSSVSTICKGLTARAVWRDRRSVPPVRPGLSL